TVGSGVPPKESIKTLYKTIGPEYFYRHTKTPMNSITDLPLLCQETGLTCETCVEHTASKLARVCQGLQGRGLGQMFVQIYPEASCSRMHSHFAAASRTATQQLRAELSPARPAVGSPAPAFAIA